MLPPYCMKYKKHLFNLSFQLVLNSLGIPSSVFQGLQGINLEFQGFSGLK